MMKLASFSTNKVNLKIDFKDFDISKESYFKGDIYHTAKEYELILCEIAKLCNEDGNYTIDYYNNRYTVRLKSDIEKIRLADMSESEIKAKEIKQLKNKHLSRIAELEKLLKDTDYYIIKMMEGAIVKDDILEIILQRQLWRDEINQLEQFDYSTIK